jgi:hypothetical protein
MDKPDVLFIAGFAVENLRQFRKYYYFQSHII